MFAISLGLQTWFDGAVMGLTYGMLAAGLVLIYRSSGIVNFAHTEVGAFGASFLALMVIEWDWPFVPALLLAVLSSAALSAVVELTVVRRLFDAPRVILLIATVGAAQILLLCRMYLPDVEGFHRYPVPFTVSWQIGSATVRGDHLLVIATVPVLVGALAWFLSRTLTGTAVRGAAANAEASRLMGINVKGLSTLVWTLAGAISGVAAIVVRPLQGVPVTSADASLDAKLLVTAMAAALVGKMTSLPRALAAGVVIGIVERMMLLNWPDDPGRITLFLLVVILVMAVRVRSPEPRRARWSFAPHGMPVPASLERIWAVRHLGRIGAGAALAVGVALPLLVTTPSRQQLYAEVLIFALLALSTTVLTGWAGQLSLGQFAFAGLGAFTTAALMRSGSSFGVAVVVSAVVVTLIALSVGAPALRVSGLLLAVTTLAFAVFTRSWFLGMDLLDDGQPSIRIPRMIEGGIDFGDQRTYYWLCLAVLTVAVWVVARLRRRGIGRGFVAVRENEPAAAAMSVSPTRAKLTAFGISGALAGLAGALYGGLYGRLDPAAFPPETSVQIAALAVIGGLGSVTGAVLGALWVVGLPALFGSTPEVTLLTSGAGLLILLMYFPGGLVQVVYAARDALFGWLDRRAPAVGPPERPATLDASRPVAVAERPALANGTAALRAEGVTVRFGPARAVDGVSLEIAPREIVGLMGANGAGKTTLMNAIGGFVPCDGRVWLGEHELSTMAPAQRARRGLGRAFQNAELFGDLTVRETVQVALERTHRTSLVGTLVGWPGSARVERRQRTEADELIALLGLGRYADALVGNLSTGTRRIAELACLLALDAPVLCLDEPTAGVAQKETEAFGPLLQEIRARFGITMLVIEHDMPLIMSISDRVYCMDQGTIIAAGTPEQVRNDPAVIASYLGTDERAIQRSGPVRS